MRYKDFFYQNKFFRFIAEAVIFILMIGFYLHQTLLIPQWSKLYSKALAYRLQTDAFMQGSLSLSPHPFGMIWDFNYTELGMQQHWGLGVPILRFPFEYLFHICKFGYFPDRIVALCYLTLMIVLMSIALRSLLSLAGLDKHSWLVFFVRWGLIGWLLFFLPIHDLIQRRLGSYEEAVFYGYLLSGILLAFFWMYIQRKQSWVFIILCLVSGFAWLIRPTLIFYGATTVGLALIVAYQENKDARLVLIGAFCFLTAASLELVFNYFRFGSILEFGFSANFNCPSVNYSNRFDSIYHHESWWNAARELGSTLFFKHQYIADRFWRFREYYSYVFNFLHCLIFLSDIIFLCFFSFSRSLRKECFGDRNTTYFRIIFFSFAWGSICFGSLFIFYTYTQAISTRYLTDFSTAFYALLMVFFLVGSSVVIVYFKGKEKNILSATLFLVITGALIFSTKGFVTEHTQNELQFVVTDQKGIDKEMVLQRKELLFNPKLPATLRCGNPESLLTWNFSRVYNWDGWNISTNCLVSSTTSIFMPTSKCITINYSIMDDPESLKIQVKRGLQFLTLNTPQGLDDNWGGVIGKAITQRYCSEKFLPNTIALYTIAWITPDKVAARGQVVHVRLNWVSVDNNRFLEK